MTVLGIASVSTASLTQVQVVKTQLRFTVRGHPRQTLLLDDSFREVKWECEEPEGRDV